LSVPNTLNNEVVKVKVEYLANLALDSDSNPLYLISFKTKER
jgi:hypothetical protein